MIFSAIDYGGAVLILSMVPFFIWPMRRVFASKDEEVIMEEQSRITGIIAALTAIIGFIIGSFVAF